MFKSAFNSDAYAAVKNAHFRGAVLRAPEMPDFTLGVGDAENLAPTNITYNVKPAQQAVKRASIKTQDDYADDLSGLDLGNYGDVYGS